MNCLFSISLLVLAFLMLPLTNLQADACTRALFTAGEGIVITGRTMDWKEDMSSNLWVFPKGIKREGLAGENSIKWTSKYGSIVVSAYDIGTADGLNDAGLAANLLFLAESEYGVEKKNTPKVAVSLWAQYVLDNYATVKEAVEALKKEPFTIITATLPNGVAAKVHLSISDKSGDSAIFQYIEGKLKIYHGKEFTVMTNSPEYSEQLALNKYWQSIGGLVFLPGTNRASDRFARAYFLINAIPREIAKDYIGGVPGHTLDNQAIASVLSVMRGVSVPLGITTPDEPNISSTIWRVIADHKNMVLYFDSATSPNTFWIQMADLDLKAGAPVKKLTVAGGKIYSGNAASNLEETPSFEFLAVR